MNKIALSILALALSANSFAQKAGNTTKSLVKAEQELIKLFYSLDF